MRVYRFTFNLVLIFFMFFVMSLAWSFLWWVYLVYKSTNSGFALFFLMVNFLVIHGFAIWNARGTGCKQNTWAIILTFVFCGFLIYYTELSGQGIFEHIINVLKAFTGTVSFIFSHTRAHIEVVRFEGYIGSLDYIFLTASAVYAGLLRLFKKNKLLYKRRKKNQA